MGVSREFRMNVEATPHQSTRSHVMNRISRSHRTTHLGGTAARRLLIGATTLLVGFAGTTLPARSAGSVAVQPGSSLEFGNSFCTMNWVYTGGGGVYVGAAGHCTTGVGQTVQVSTASLGSPIGTIGTVAFVSKTLDYCLIKLDSSVSWSPAMAGHPNIPTGVSTPSTAKTGDLVQFSGHGVGFDLLTTTQQSRMGIFNFFDSGNQYVVGPITPGDSGGPVADVSDGNKALGIVDTVGLTLALPNANVGEGGVAVYALLDDAHKDFDPGLQLVTV
jgi:hypothetical protein